MPACAPPLPPSPPPALPKPATLHRLPTMDFLIHLFTVAALVATGLAAGLAVAAFAAVQTVKDIAAALLILATGYGFAVLILSL